MKIGKKAFGLLNYKTEKITLMRNSTSEESSWIEGYIFRSSGAGVEQE